MAACTRPGKPKPNQVPAKEGGAGYNAPPLSEELLAIVSCRERKAQFFSKNVATDKLTTIQQKATDPSSTNWPLGGWVTKENRDTKLGGKGK